MTRSGLLISATVCLLLIGCGTPAAREADKETFDRLYGEYRQRVYQEVDRNVEKMTADDVSSLAQKTWEEAFKDHADLLRRLAETELAALPAARPPELQRYDAQEARVVPALGPYSNLCRRLASQLCSPLEAARNGNWLWYASFDDMGPFAAYGSCWLAADPKIEALDRSVDHPKLQMQAGPTIIQVELVWAGLQYHVTRSRMYYPKGRGKLAQGPDWRAPLEVVLAPDGSLKMSGETLLPEGVSVLPKDAINEAERRALGGYVKISIQLAHPAKNTYAQLLGILEAIDYNKMAEIRVNDVPLRLSRWLPFIQVDFGGDHPRCDMNDPAQLQKLQEAKDRLPLFLRVWLRGKPDTPMTTVIEHLKTLNELDLAVGFLRQRPLPKQPPTKK
jgi:hypothetical protein